MYLLHEKIELRKNSTIFLNKINQIFSIMLSSQVAYHNIKMITVATIKSNQQSTYFLMYDSSYWVIVFNNRMCGGVLFLKILSLF
jgi:hypothetical protein